MADEKRTDEKKDPRPPAATGAELVRRLRESGTGADKLAVARRVLEDLDGRASPADVVAALEAAFPGSVTAEKARQFADRGEYEPAAARPAPVPIEDRLAPPGAGTDRPGVGPGSAGQDRPGVEKPKK